jgi:hypothetical protein
MIIRRVLLQSRRAFNVLQTNVRRTYAADHAHEAPVKPPVTYNTPGGRDYGQFTPWIVLGLVLLYEYTGNKTTTPQAKVEKHEAKAHGHH